MIISVIRSITLSFIFSSIYLLISFQLSTYIESYSEVKAKLAFMSPFSLLRISEIYKKVNGINVFDVFVEKSLMIIIANVFIIIMLQVLIAQIIFKGHKFNRIIKR